LGTVEAIFLLTSAGTKKDEYAPFVKEVQPKIKEFLEKYEAEKAQIDNFWDRATYPNLLLTRYLLGIRGNEVKKVAKAYHELWDWAGNDNNRTREIEHLDLIELSLGLLSHASAKELAAGIQAMKNELMKDLNKT
jgi:hypothetical protein